MHPETIGTFRVLRELGRGGMGEVYLGRDTRLDRDVAIKSLPAHLAQDADRLARFQREAKVLASLNHPGIGAIHGLEEADGRQYLILEYVEGETLAARMTRGPLPPDEALLLAKQMAEALEAAHERGVVHRDLKPANLMLTPDGRVKVLDFGLARTEDAPASSASHAAIGESPTLASPARVHSPTIPGTIMGTAGYMSPEQARGKLIDKRSDIFSFGCVLYEMLTGEQPFRGDSAADSIGATLHKEPDLALLPADTPVALVSLFKRCTVKDRHHRLRDIGDARVELEQLIANPGAARFGPADHAVAAPPRTAVLLAALAFLAIGAAAGALAMRSSRNDTVPPAREHRVVRAALALPKGAVLQVADRSVAVSPDGQQVAIAAFPSSESSIPSLYLRDLAKLDCRTLQGAEGASYPFWSPDGKSIGFFADTKLKRIDLPDGIVRTLADAPAGRGGSWGSKGTIVFAPSAIGGLWTVGDTGGTPQPATTPTRQGEGHRLPQMLPDGRRFLYLAQGVEPQGVCAFDPDTKESRLVLAGDAEGFFVEPGLLAFVRDDNLLVQPFDPGTLGLTGTARPMAAGVERHINRGFVNLGLSARGTLVYQQALHASKSRLAWMDRAGARTPIDIEPLRISKGELSRDGRRVVAQVEGDRAQPLIAVLDLERGTRTAVGDPKSNVEGPFIWSGDARSVYCTAEIDGVWRILNCTVGAGGPPRIVMGEPGFEYHPGSITPDGKTLLFSQWNNRDKVGDLMTLDLQKDGPARPFMVTPQSEYVPRLSRAGDAVAYQYSESGADVDHGLLYAVAYPSPAAPVQVSLSPITDQRGWLTDHELYWIDAKRRLWSAIIAVKDRQVDVGAPKPIRGDHPVEKSVAVLDFDQTRERFLIAIAEDADEHPQLVIVSDWRPGAIPEPAGHK